MGGHKGVNEQRVATDREETAQGIDERTAGCYHQIAGELQAPSQ